MTEYQFALNFSTKSSATEIDAIVERRGKEGCNDALVGIEMKGFDNLDVTRGDPAAFEAIKNALADVKRAILGSLLVKERKTP